MKEGVLIRGWPPEFHYDYSAMSLEKALLMIEAAKQKAKDMRFSMILAVCDASGNLVALERMDDAPLVSLEISINKARTAVFGKIPTDQWGMRFKGTEPRIAPLWFHTGWITFVGGFPIVLEGRIIGGIGCSGGFWEDAVVSRAGLLVLGADTSGAESFLKNFGIPVEKW